MYGKEAYNEAVADDAFDYVDAIVRQAIDAFEEIDPEIKDLVRRRFSDRYPAQALSGFAGLLGQSLAPVGQLMDAQRAQYLGAPPRYRGGVLGALGAALGF